MAIYDNRVCVDCGATFSGGPRSWRCPECRAERNRTTHREQQRRAREGKKRQLGAKYKCENCGEEYVLKGGLQKYCEKCQPIMHAALDNKQSTDYYYRNYTTPEGKARRSVIRRKHYALHKFEINFKRRLYRVKNIDAFREKSREYYVKNKGTIRGKARKYRANNGERMRENEREWRNKNPEKVKAANARKYAKWKVKQKELQNIGNPKGDQND